MALKKCFCIFPFNPATTQVGGMCYQIPAKEDAIRIFYYDEQDAQADAESMAAAKPGCKFIILEAKTIVEAKMPETIAKSWKDNGELIPIEKAEKRKKPAFGEAMDAIAEQFAVRTERPRNRPARPAETANTNGQQAGIAAPQFMQFTPDPAPNGEIDWQNNRG